MAFLQIEDYDNAIKRNILTDITEGDDTNRTTAELTAQSKIESYLRMRYNVATVFAATGTDRNPIIVQFMVDITLYLLHKRINPNQIPTLRMDEYDEAIKWLEMVSKGKLSPDLPELPNDEGNSGVVSYGSNTKRTHNW